MLISKLFWGFGKQPTIAPTNLYYSPYCWCFKKEITDDKHITSSIKLVEEMIIFS